MPDAHNRLIESLPRRDRALLLGSGQVVDLLFSEVLAEKGGRTRYAYFPIDGYISLVTPLDGAPVLEVGMVGREGMLGTQLVLGVGTAPLHALVQGAGTALRIAAGPFRKQLGESKALRESLLSYVQVTMIQLASSAACVRFHQVGPRLARWLLMTQDRASGDSFHVTHEFLSYMLGVRRVGVTTAAQALHRRGLIDYQRGNLTVRNRRGLEAAACSCYGSDRSAYADIMH